MRVHAYYYLRVSARVAPGPRESQLVANARIAGAEPRSAPYSSGHRPWRS